MDFSHTCKTVDSGCNRNKCYDTSPTFSFHKARPRIRVTVTRACRLSTPYDGGPRGPYNHDLVTSDMLHTRRDVFEAKIKNKIIHFYVSIT